MKDTSLGRATLPHARGWESVIDPEIVAEMVEGLGRDGMAMLTDSLRTETGELIARLGGELARNDVAASAATLHSIKGVSLNLGCVALGGVAATWEERAADGDRPPADLPATLESLLGVSLSALESTVHGLCAA